MISTQPALAEECLPERQRTPINKELSTDLDSHLTNHGMMRSKPTARATGKIEVFLDEATGFSCNGVKLCIENALKARGYDWRIYITEIAFAEKGEEGKAKRASRDK